MSKNEYIAEPEIQNANTTPKSAIHNPQSTDSALLEELSQLAAQRIGLSIHDPTRARFAAILHERSKRHGSLADYRNFLVEQQASEEWEELSRLFTSGETYFFRDHGQFDLLRLSLLPGLIAQHRHDRTLRLWSAGCASGEEVYSLAILVDMLLPDRSDWNILILGTDIDSLAVARARRGRYGQWSFRMVPEELQQRYFQPAPIPQSAFRNHQSNEWVLNERIRSMVTFGVANLVTDTFPDSGSELHDMDLILCRNVFIYFEAAAVFAVATRFAATLREGGYLLTAHTELMGHMVCDLESRLLAEGVVYRRRVQAPVIRPVIHQGSEPLPPITALMEQRMEPLSIGLRCKKTVPKPLLIAIPPGNQKTVATRLVIPRQLGKEGEGNDEALLKEARTHADHGDFEQAGQACRKALASHPLSATAYFMLAQLAEIKGDSHQAKECLNKALYLDHRFVAAHLELAAIYEREKEMPRAHALRRAALGIVSALPADAVIAQYETTAGELAHWLTQWEQEPFENQLQKPGKF